MGLRSLCGAGADGDEADVVLLTEVLGGVGERGQAWRGDSCTVSVEMTMVRTERNFILYSSGFNILLE